MLGRAPLGETEWAGRDGINLPVPRRGADWLAWSRRVRVDQRVRDYAAAVYAASDAYLAALGPDALARPPQAAVPGGQTLNWLLNNLLIQHAAVHGGEIAVLRGIQGLQGLPQASPPSSQRTGPNEPRRGRLLPTYEG